MRKYEKRDVYFNNYFLNYSAEKRTLLIKILFLWRVWVYAQLAVDAIYGI